MPFLLKTHTQKTQKNAANFRVPPAVPLLLLKTENRILPYIGDSVLIDNLYLIEMFS